MRRSPLVLLALRAGLQDLVYAVGDELGRAAELADGPVGRVALGHVGGPGVVDQPLGQRTRQGQVAVGDGDQAVAEAVETRMYQTFCPGSVKFDTRSQIQCAPSPRITSTSAAK